VPKGASIFIDGERIDAVTRARGFVDPGPHTVRVELPPAPAHEETIDANRRVTSVVRASF
jgi:hypothetical protein